MKIKHFSTLIIILDLLLNACTRTNKPTPTAVLLPATATPASIPPTQTSTALPPTITPEAVSQGAVVDDFEAAQTVWQPGKMPDYQDSSAISAVLSSDYTAQGKQSLALTFEKSDKPKATFFLNRQIDASQAGALVFDLNDPDGNVEAVAIALCTGGDWYWHESEPVTVQTGANTISFDLRASQYKTAATNWQPTTSIASLADIRRVAILLSPKASGTVYLDNVRLLPVGESINFTSTAQPNSPGEGTSTQSTSWTCTDQPEPPRLTELPLALFLSAGVEPLQYDQVEFDLIAQAKADNPFDPAEIDLVVHYTAPDGSQFSVPVFWYQAYDPRSSKPCGPASWKARMTPAQPGEWEAQAEIIHGAASEAGMKSEPVTFQVAPSDNKGFVRINTRNPHYFAFDDGSTFFPVGLNIGWWSTDPLSDYARWMDKLQENGATLIRVWMASWSFGIEWSSMPLGDYGARLYQAWLLDQVFQMAYERGIYIELVLLNHGAFSTNVNPEWEANPYNVANGGMCAEPTCFVTNPEARQYFKRRLRYIASRWGYSSNLFAWEWWNEVNLTPISPDDLAPWIFEMTDTLRQYDPYRHLISLSYAGTGLTDIFNMPQIDFTQHHEYSQSDPMTNFQDIYDWEALIFPGKPVMFAEFGYSAGIEDTGSIDKEGLHLHNGLWAATFAGFACPAMYWWWDLYIEPLDLWGQFGALTHFLAGEDLAELSTLGEGRIRLVGSNGKTTALAGVMALYNKNHLLAWVRDKAYNSQQLERAYLDEVIFGKTPETTWTFKLDPVRDLTLTIDTLQDGDYRAKWYDPSTAQWIEDTLVKVQDGSVTLAVPTFTNDLALKIEAVK